ncbi:Sugar phosphate isomerase/epimerase [Archaeoglobus sulfaticallidus PM70-1]|uniref:Sugar phosphate isomerase/epimerase n=1 Tax=Archaeoglobus sulfaticallidus PM70-1 TaxID=387631 RepID=N0BKC3_9EURY|nr:sugar phosphate isomerase/epimerase [Archaeoglobus sulfaticallidus]AGK60610.1 Sugar phosphate isomerase/epimerase [Archaeoglobus sulfaticallidus PM70-1]
MRLGAQPDVNHSLKKAFEFTSRQGFSHIEILMDHPWYHHEKLNYAEILELKGSYDLDVLIHASATATNFISISSQMRAASYRELEKTISFAYKTESELITFHIGWNPGLITAGGFVYKKEWYSEHNYRVLTGEMLKFLRKIDSSILALENTIEIDYAMRSAIEVLLEKTDLSLTFDIGHWNVKSSHQIFIENFDRVRNIHLHDNNGDYDSHLPLGKGNVRLDAIPLERYDGYMTLELRDEKAILKSKEYLEKLGYLLNTNRFSRSSPSTNP